MTLLMFLEEIRKERNMQAEKWGDGTWESLDAIDDDKNGPLEFTAYIAHHATRWFPGGFPPYSNEALHTFRNQMIKVAALAYAAVAWVDRRLDQ